jgi:HAD superfamily hydrolase (TIGR01509 family)
MSGRSAAFLPVQFETTSQANMSQSAIVVFDLGKVLLDFDYRGAVSRFASRSAASPEEIRSFLLTSRAIVDYELGRLTREEFFRQAQQAAGFRGTLEEFGNYFADIFTPIPPMIELQASLRRRGVPTYIFSNTNDLAVEHIRRSFPFFKNFDGYIFSYEVGAMKPDAKIYEALEKLAGRRGAEIFYLDDRPENVVAGAVRGWRTILHETPEKTRTSMERLELLDGQNCSGGL